MCRFCLAKLCYRRRVPNVSSALFGIRQIFRKRDRGVGPFETHTISILHIDKDFHCGKLHVCDRPINKGWAGRKIIAVDCCLETPWLQVSAGRMNMPATDRKQLDLREPLTMLSVKRSAFTFSLFGATPETFASMRLQPSTLALLVYLSTLVSRLCSRCSQGLDTIEPRKRWRTSLLRRRLRLAAKERDDCKDGRCWKTRSVNGRKELDPRRWREEGSRLERTNGKEDLLEGVVHQLASERFRL